MYLDLYLEQHGLYIVSLHEPLPSISANFHSLSPVTKA